MQTHKSVAPVQDAAGTGGGARDGMALRANTIASRGGEEEERDGR